MIVYCGKPARTIKGRLCRRYTSAARPCPHHGTGDDGIAFEELLAREKQMRVAPPPATGMPIAARPSPPRALRPGLPEPVAARDLHGVCWWLIERAAEGPPDSRWGTVAVSAVRLLVSLPAAELSDDERRDEAYLRGKILNGIPPETADEWELAKKIYDDEALDDLESWNPHLLLLERDHRHVHQPLAFPQLAGEEADPA